MACYFVSVSSLWNSNFPIHLKKFNNWFVLVFSTKLWLSSWLSQVFLSQFQCEFLYDEFVVRHFDFPITQQPKNFNFPFNLKGFRISKAWVRDFYKFFMHNISSNFQAMGINIWLTQAYFHEIKKIPYWKRFFSTFPLSSLAPRRGPICYLHF